MGFRYGFRVRSYGCARDRARVREGNLAETRINTVYFINGAL